MKEAFQAEKEISIIEILKALLSIGQKSPLIVIPSDFLFDLVYIHTENP